MILRIFLRKRSYSDLYRGVADSYAFSRFHDNVGLRDFPAIRHIKSANAVVMNDYALVGNAILHYSTLLNLDQKQMVALNKLRCLAGLPEIN